MWHQTSANGKVRYFERYKDAYGKTKTASVTFDKHNARTEKQAMMMLSEIIQEKSTPVSNKPMRDIIDLYMASYKTRVKPHTYNNSKFYYDNLKEMFGDVIASEMGAGIFNAKMLELGIKKSVVNVYMARLKTCIRWAYKNDLIDNISWLEKLETNRVSHKRPEDKFIEADQIPLVAEALKPKYRPLFYFLCLSGLRIGEAMALKASNISLEDRTLSVKGTMSHSEKKVETPKTESSVRTIYIQDQLYDLCEELVQGLNPDDFVFDISMHVFRKNIGMAGMKALGRRISPHTCRHTHASLLFEQGFSCEMAQLRLGHKTDAVTREIYIHLTERRNKADNERLKSLNLF